MEDRRCKLGLAGRLELVRLVEQGCVVEGGRGRPRRGAGDGASVVASVAGGWRAGAGLAGVPLRRGRRGRGRVRGRWGERPSGAILAARERRRPTGRRGWRGWSALHRGDDLEGAQAPRCLAAPSQRRGRASRRYRVGRSRARCCISTRCSCRSSTRPGHWASGTRRPTQSRRRARQYGRHRSRSTTTAGWPTASCTRPRTRRDRQRRRCDAPRPGCATRAAARSRRS